MSNTDPTTEGRLARLHDMLHTDQTGLVAGLELVLATARGYEWATQSRGSYEWDDDEFHKEMGRMLAAIREAAQTAIDRWKAGGIPRPCCDLCSAPEPSGWQPIETAPKNVDYFVHILAYQPATKCVYAVYWDAELELFCALQTTGRVTGLTHWMPMPTGPQPLTKPEKCKECGGVGWTAQPDPRNGDACQVQCEPCLGTGFAPNGRGQQP